MARKILMLNEIYYKWNLKTERESEGESTIRTRMRITTDQTNE